MIQGATGLQRWAESFTNSPEVCSLASTRVDKPSNMKMHFILLYVHLPRGSFMGIFLELKIIERVVNGDWGILRKEL